MHWREEAWGGWLGLVCLFWWDFSATACLYVLSLPPIILSSSPPSSSPPTPLRCWYPPFDTPGVPQV